MNINEELQEARELARCAAKDVACNAAYAASDAGYAVCNASCSVARYAAWTLGADGGQLQYQIDKILEVL